MVKYADMNWSIRWLRIALSMVMISAVRCSSPVVVVASVAELPPSASFLEAMIALDGRTAHELLVMQLTQGRPFTFGLNLPTDSIGKEIIISVASRDSTGCRFSIGDSQSVLLNAIHEGGNLPIDVFPVPLSSPDCSGQDIVVLDVTPNSVSTAGTDLDGLPITASLVGWGFQPGAAVALDGVAAPSVEWISGTRMRAVMPQVAGTLNTFATLQVRNPEHSQLTRIIDGMPGAASMATGGGITVRHDLLKYDSLGYPFQGIPTKYLINADLSGRMLSADFTGDGLVDFVVLNDKVTLFPNSGDGSFGAPQNATYSTTDAIKSIKSVDINNDGRRDLLLVRLPNQAGCSSSFIIDILTNNGLPNVFGTPRTLQYTSASCAIWDTVEMSFSDQNGDGYQDLIILAEGGNILYFPNDKLGGFGAIQRAPGVGIIGSVDARPYKGFVVIDLNHDGRPDIAALRGHTFEGRFNRELVPLINDGFGQLILGNAAAITSNIFQISKADFDRNRKDDLIVKFDLDFAKVLMNVDEKLSASGSFDLDNLPILSGLDINKDNWPDTLDWGDLANPETSTGPFLRSLKAQLNLRNGRLGAIINIPISGAGFPVYLGDLDGDGDVDVLSLINNGLPRVPPWELVIIHNYPH